MSSEEKPSVARLGDLLTTTHVSPKMLKALAVIATTLHQTYETFPFSFIGKSKESCVLMSLTVRDFLHEIGFEDAKVLPVFLYFRKMRGKEVVHTLGVGAPEDKDSEGRWAGHMVVVVPSETVLIDPTVYSARRPHWDSVPGMVATPTSEYPLDWGGLKAIGSLVDEAEADITVAIWFANPANTRWRKGPDVKRREWRRSVVNTMVERFRGRQA